MSDIINLDEKTFETEVLKSNLPVLVDFWADWCGPCHMMAPVLEEAAKEFDGKLRIAKLDVEVPAHRGLVEQFRIMSIPNMKIFKDGKVVKELVGFRPKEQFFEELRVL